MFYDCNGEIFKKIASNENGSWMISYDHPISPMFVTNSSLKEMEPVNPPKEFLYKEKERVTAGETRRLLLIEPLTEDIQCVFDTIIRREKIKKLAEENHTSERRIRNLYFRYLAGKPLLEPRKSRKREETEDEKNFKWAIETMYYSAKKFSLKTVYDFMVLSKYTDESGQVKENTPNWDKFKHYFYANQFHKKNRKYIARNGLTDYQRNKRPITGSSQSWKQEIGAYQMDATTADIYLVSKLNRKNIIGRPYIYLAVDTATQLIAGVYIGLDSNEQSVISCIANAAADKVEYCKRYGIDITKDMWPNEGLPKEIITDKGREFIGPRMKELILKFGIEVESLPPFRPDQKGIVEKSFDLLQKRYKPILRGKGVIEADAAERWAIDYRKQAVLTLDEFTKVLIHCILYLNSKRILENYTGIGAVPIPSKLWKWYQEQGKSSIMAINSEDLYLLSLLRENSKVTRKGIKHAGLYYSNQSYKKLLEQKIGESVVIAYDPQNVSNIYLVKEQEYLKMELTEFCRSYADATEQELKREKEEKKKQLKAWKQEELEGRVELLKNIQSIVDEIRIEEKDSAKKEEIEQNRKREKDL